MSVLINPRDLQFILLELLDVEKLCQSDRYAHCDKAMFEAPLETAHRIALDQFEPLAKICDEAEPRMEEGRTILPDGVADVMNAYIDAGLLNASSDLSEGGSSCRLVSLKPVWRSSWQQTRRCLSIRLSPMALLPSLAIMGARFRKNCLLSRCV